MKNILFNLYMKIYALFNQEEGQDLVEYALIVALIALAATAGMTKLATAISTGFSNVGATLSGTLT